jgi:hypothetical protein
MKSPRDSVVVRPEGWRQSPGTKFCDDTQRPGIVASVLPIEAEASSGPSIAAGVGVGGYAVFEQVNCWTESYGEPEDSSVCHKGSAPFLCLLDAAHRFLSLAERTTPMGRFCGPAAFGEMVGEHKGAAVARHLPNPVPQAAASFVP